MKRLITILFLLFFGEVYCQEVLVKQGVYRLHSFIDTNFVYPEWYGANATDTVNDRTAINLAIEAAHAKNKDVWLGKGSYKISSWGYDTDYSFKFAIRLRGNVRLVGHGAESRIYSTVNSDSFAILAVRDSSSKILIQDIQLVSDSCTLGVGIYVRPGCEDISINRVWITGGVCVGIKTQEVAKGSIKDCNINFTASSTTESAGIKLINSTKWTVDNNLIVSDATRALQKDRFGGGIWVFYDTTGVLRPSGNKIINNTITNITGAGIRIYGDSSSTYSENHLSEIDGIGINVDGENSGSKTISKSISIEDNIIKNCFYKAASYTNFCFGVYARYAHDLSIVNNTIDSIIGYDTTMLAEALIYIDGCRTALISENKISNSYFNGIYTKDANTISISANIIKGCGYATVGASTGIYTTSDYVSIIGNVIIDTSLPIARIANSIYVNNNNTSTIGNSFRAGPYFDAGTAVDADNTSW